MARRPALAAVLGLLAVAFAALPAGAQDTIEREDPILLILDASGSMNGDDGSGRPKIDAAKDAVAQVIQRLPEGVPVGLRVYGHRVPNTDRDNGCQDSELVVPVTPLDRSAFTGVVNAITAQGFTPIGLSLQQAVADLPADTGGTVILVSDGIDTCAPPDPCQVALDIGQAGGPVEIRVETVGFQADEAARAQLACIADAAGGEYRDASDADSLAEALFQAQGDQISGGATAEDALLLESGQYRDTLALFQQRWYAVDLLPGQSLAVDATLGNRLEPPHPGDARYVVQLRRGDLLGDLACDSAEAGGVGPSPLPLSLATPVVQEDSGTGECADAGRHLIRLALEHPEFRVNDPDEAPLRELVYDVELIVAVTGDPVGASETPATAEAPPPAPVAPLTSNPGATGGQLLLIAVGLGGLGFVAGSFAGRRAGA